MPASEAAPERPLWRLWPADPEAAGADPHRPEAPLMGGRQFWINVTANLVAALVIWLVYHWLLHPNEKR